MGPIKCDQVYDQLKETVIYANSNKYQKVAIKLENKIHTLADCKSSGIFPCISTNFVIPKNINLDENLTQRMDLERGYLSTECVGEHED